MEPRELIELMKIINQLKDTTRHSWSKAGRVESVAEHVYSMCCAAFLLKDEFVDVDMNHVIELCLFHDLGEAFTGDIPAFHKNQDDEIEEQAQIQNWLMTLPQATRTTLSSLFKEMEEMKSKEAKVYKALDKLDALLMHNEADIATWLPLEYELNLHYGDAQCAWSPYFQTLRAMVKTDTEKKIAEAKESSNIFIDNHEKL